MQMAIDRRALSLGLTGGIVLWSIGAGAWPAEGSETTTAASKILVEISLSPDHKNDVDTIKREFATVGITKVRHKVFQLGHPPTNIAIGRNVSADVARLTIRLATMYNRGITRLLPEERLAPDYVAFGTSIFDELFQYPVSEADVARLESPDLTTEQFHQLYRQLADINQRPYR
jgi:hypothetical protein